MRGELMVKRRRNNRNRMLEPASDLGKHNPLQNHEKVPHQAKTATRFAPGGRFGLAAP
jgi:hypothetical protein